MLKKDKYLYIYTSTYIVYIYIYLLVNFKIFIQKNKGKFVLNN